MIGLITYQFCAALPAICPHLKRFIVDAITHQKYCQRKPSYLTVQTRGRIYRAIIASKSAAVGTSRVPQLLSWLKPQDKYRLGGLSAEANQNGDRLMYQSELAMSLSSDHTCFPKNHRVPGPTDAESCPLVLQLGAFCCFNPGVFHHELL